MGKLSHVASSIWCLAILVFGLILTWNIHYVLHSVVKSDVILQLGPLEIRSVAAPLKTAFSEAVNLFTNTSFSRKEALRAKKGLSAFNSDRLIHVNVLTRGVIKD